MSSSRAALVACLGLATASCADWSRGVPGADVPASEADAGGGAAFSAVHPLLVAGCRDCHSADGEAGDTSFLLGGMTGDDYATTVAFVDVGAPASSRLLVKMSGAGHGGGPVFGTASPEFATVLRWIREGALP